MTNTVLIAIYCLAVPQAPVWSREPRPVEAPACMPYEEPFIGSVQECNRYAITQTVRLRALYGPPIIFQGAYCRVKP